jgi:hypothetical protein
VLLRDPRVERELRPEPVRPESDPDPVVEPADEPMADPVVEPVAVFAVATGESSDLPAGGRPQSSQIPSTILPVHPGRLQRSSIGSSYLALPHPLPE